MHDSSTQFYVTREELFGFVARVSAEHGFLTLVYLKADDRPAVAYKPGIVSRDVLAGRKAIYARGR